MQDPAVHLLHLFSIPKQKEIRDDKEISLYKKKGGVDYV